MERQNPEFQDFGTPKSWIQYSGMLKSWIQDFGTTQSCVHVYPEFMVFDFEIFWTTKSWIQDFGILTGTPRDNSLKIALRIFICPRHYVPCVL